MEHKQLHEFPRKKNSFATYSHAACEKENVTQREPGAGAAAAYSHCRMTISFLSLT